jgi:hypothetical protein
MASRTRVSRQKAGLDMLLSSVCGVSSPFSALCQLVTGGMYEDVSAVTKVSRSMLILRACAYLSRKPGMEDQSRALSLSLTPSRKYR